MVQRTLYAIAETMKLAAHKIRTMSVILYKISNVQQESHESSMLKKVERLPVRNCEVREFPWPSTSLPAQSLVTIRGGIGESPIPLLFNGFCSPIIKK